MRSGPHDPAHTRSAPKGTTCSEYTTPSGSRSAQRVSRSRFRGLVRGCAATRPAGGAAAPLLDPRRARGAVPEHVDDVLRPGEAVRGRDLARPLLHRIRLDLDGRAAPPADEVVVVPA